MGEKTNDNRDEREEAQRKWKRRRITQKKGDYIAENKDIHLKNEHKYVKKYSENSITYCC